MGLAGLVRWRIHVSRVDAPFDSDVVGRVFDLKLTAEGALWQESEVTSTLSEAGAHELIGVSAPKS